MSSETYPRTWVELAEDLANPDIIVKRYPWGGGLAYRSRTNGLGSKAVTAIVNGFLNRRPPLAGLVDVEGVEWKQVRLTDVGRAWLESARAVTS